MTLKIKTALFIVTISLISLGSIYFISSRILTTNFKQIETDEMAGKLDIAKNTVNVVTDNLIQISKDYSNWDDTYQFIDDGNPEYVATNLIPQNMKSIGIDVMVFINNQGKIIWSGEYDPKKQVINYLPKDLDEIVRTRSFLVRTGLEKDTNGVLKLHEGSLVFTALPILTSKFEGPPKGTLFTGKYLDDARVKEIADITKVNLKYYPVSELPPRVYSMGSDKLNNASTFIFSENPDELLGFAKITDINGATAGVFEVSTSRTVTQVGSQTVKYIIYTILLAGIIYIVVGILYLDKTIIGPIKKLVTQMQIIGNSGSNIQRVTVRGDHEINELSDNINEMLDSLDKSKEYQKIINQELGEKSVKLEEKTMELEKTNKGIEYKVEEKTHQIKEEKARLISAINSVPFGFILFNPGKDVMLINEMLNPILKINEHKWSLDKLDSLFTGVNMFESFDDCVRQKQSVILDNLTYKNGFFKIEFSPVLIGHKETLRVIGVIMLIEDITEETIIERSKEEFFSIASHELRTPLSTIKGNAQLIKKYYSKTIQDKNFEEIIDDIYSASLRLIQLVNDFLTTSKLEQSQIKISKESFDIISMMQDTVREMQTHALEKNLVLLSDYSNQEFVNVIGDRNLVKEVLINLIGNAIKFTKIGSIQVYAMNIGEAVKISVRDTGRGISPPNQNLLFRKFQQANDSLITRDPEKGSGLGLYISKMIIETMGGKIFLEDSKEGVGSTFSFTLPFEKPGDNLDKNVVQEQNTLKAPKKE